MADGVLSNVVRDIITKLGSRALHEIGLWWGVKGELKKLEATVSSIRNVLLDAEEQQKLNRQVKGWLERLEEVVYDADDLVDDFATEALRRRVMTGNRMTKEVSTRNLGCIRATDHSDLELMANSESNSFHLFVRMPKRKPIKILVKSNFEVQFIQQKILVISKIPVTQQKLYYKGEKLEWNKTLEDCSIQNKAWLKLVVELDGESELFQMIHQISSTICRMYREKSVSRIDYCPLAHKMFALLAPERNEQSELLLIAYSVPATLVMFYRSRIKQQKAYARALILSSMHYLLNRPDDFLPECRLLALEFCKLLRHQVTNEDPLYQSCRTSLKQLVERSRFKIKLFEEPETVLTICSFLYEMTSTLCKGLVQIRVSNPSSHIDSLKFLFGEFQAFSCVVRNAIGYIDGDDEETLTWFSVPTKEAFNHLSTDMEGHLHGLLLTAELFETSGCLCSVSHLYLDILKELNSISQLWESEREQFRLLLKRQQSSLRLILETTTREDDYHWLLEHNDVIDSESRMHLVTMMMIPEEKLLDAEFYKPLIHWSRFLDEEMFEALKNKKLTSPKKLQDWLYKLCQVIFKPQNLLFLACPNDPTKFYPNPELKLEPLHFDCFEFSGKVIALAVMHELQIGVAFHRMFLFQLAEKDISIGDVKDAYPSFYNKKAKECFLDDDQIRNDLVNSISEQISFFRKGFDSVFGKSIVQLLSFKGIELEDLNLVLKGKLNLEFISGEITHASDPLMSQFLKINRQGLNINKSEWRMDRKKTLGGGISGNVYKGYADGGFFFAVKKIRIKDKIKQEIDRIQQEVNLLCQLRHPNIVKYYGTEEDKSGVYIFLELVSTGSLRQVYKSFKLKDSQVSYYTNQILEGLKYLHERKVVHRDIKCANILVDEKGCVKITDFGLAKVTELVPLLKSRHGTIDWIAPEVMKKDKEYGVEADIWSLGCTVLEMLTGNYPYSHVNDWDANLELEVEKGTLRNHLPNYSLSENARDFIMKCLQVDPKKRPTASQLLNHLFVKDSGC
ncbi:E3 ubiquitin-protein ligase UPL5 [Manihot esculenta]|uniref:E3 ubiquitin-protein ligase UPL5 n=1 Tax=Manihot esculenta TaxID=3983 RepID=UPI000B5D0A19|nr:E3 ubiquitin-protein ligase UPL5 [Manihot esculenta]